MVFAKTILPLILIPAIGITIKSQIKSDLDPGKKFNPELLLRGFRNRVSSFHLDLLETGPGPLQNRLRSPLPEWVGAQVQEAHSGQSDSVRCSISSSPMLLFAEWVNRYRDGAL
jgi:hypothetical protein